jgi:hypothetical protein
MPSIPPSSAAPSAGEPQARGSVIHGFRAAIVDLWGDAALASLASLLPLATRTATVDALILPFEWLPLQHISAWHEALWTGPCAGDEHELARLIARSMELGFGRFKSAFFSGTTPARLMVRAPELWRWQHTHGELSVIASDESSATIVLRDHPYIDQPTSRRVTAESIRCVVALAAAKDVRAAWGDRVTSPTSRSRELVVQLAWKASAPA